MISMKKTALAAAVMMTVGTGVAQAAPVATFNFEGSFTMYQPWQPDTVLCTDDEGNPIPDSSCPNPNATSITGPVAMVNTLDPDGVPNSGDEYTSTADPVSGTMYMDLTTGAGGASITPTIPFFGSMWTAHDISLQNMGTFVRATMLFDWSVNLNIPVVVDFSMMPNAACSPSDLSCFDVGDSFTVTTLDGNGDTIPGYPMVSGPFPNYNATFAGTATVSSVVVPVPAAVWLLGSGLLGLVGVARRKKAA